MQHSQAAVLLWRIFSTLQPPSDGFLPTSPPQPSVDVTDVYQYSVPPKSQAIPPPFLPPKQTSTLLLPYSRVAQEPLVSDTSTLLTTPSPTATLSAPLQAAEYIESTTFTPAETTTAPTPPTTPSATASPSDSTHKRRTPWAIIVPCAIVGTVVVLLMPLLVLFLLRRSRRSQTQILFLDRLRGLVRRGRNVVSPELLTQRRSTWGFDEIEDKKLVRWPVASPSPATPGLVQDSGGPSGPVFTSLDGYAPSSPPDSRRTKLEGSLPGEERLSIITIDTNGTIASSTVFGDELSKRSFPKDVEGALTHHAGALSFLGDLEAGDRSSLVSYSSRAPLIREDRQTSTMSCDLSADSTRSNWSERTARS